MRSLILIISVFYLFVTTIYGQDSIKKIALDHTVYDDWKSIDNTSISDDGSWISYELNPQKGDGQLKVINPAKNIEKSFNRAYNASFSGDSDFIVFKVKPQLDTIRKLKLAKTKKADLPKDSLMIWVLTNDSLYKFNRVKSYKLAKEKSSWIAFLLEKEKKTKEKKVVETDKKGKKKKKAKQKKKKNTDTKEKTKLKDEGTALTIFNPILNDTLSFKSITEYSLSEKSDFIAFIKTQKDSTALSTVYSFNGKSKSIDTIYHKRGTSKKLTIDKDGYQLAFIHSEDTSKTKVYSLFYKKTDTIPLKIIVDTMTVALPDKWSVSEHGNINFSEDGNKLYFGSSLRPVAEPEDSLLDEEKYSVDIWHYDDPLIQPQQLKELKKEKQRSYLTVYHPTDEKLLLLADTMIKSVRTSKKGNGHMAIGYDYEPYQKQTTWDYPRYRDVYLINVKTGEKKLIWEKHSFYSGLSPDGKYLLRYNIADSSWYSYNTSTHIENNLTKSLSVNFYDENDQTPRLPNSYGLGGWTKEDKYVLIYDQFDIWRIDPDDAEQPINLTNNLGRKDSIQFRRIKLDPDAFCIEHDEDILLKAFSKSTKDAGFFDVNINNNNSNPRQIMFDAYKFTNPLKARKSDKILFRKLSFTLYPDLIYCNLDFSDQKVVSDANPQQNNYLWGSVEIMRWKNHDGEEAKGLLYKPENFDPTKKYPAIVYFYEKYTDNIHEHYVPKPIRSVINFPYYVSNGYIILIPDIHYKTGQPGEDAYNYIVSGTEHLISLGFVDKDRVGLQGQSWGGYQVCYLITRTDMYKAAEAGAPVSNMTSAYGGIRWGSGVSRMFQYEKGQSRLGETLWENRNLFIDNSPLFFADKVNTPLLIMHNDHDGSVPWYQGIEFYTALRRLDKKVWMLTYNNEEHNLKKRPNCVDLTIRMQQFFDHYLKDAPAPEWMIEGIPATKKGITNGYKLLEKSE